ncbi:formylglycine-generating enzyme family protein [Desulfosarcina sp. OttesenSCG-928-A07]|nr:formylglycine-generating enzyme family protein [Desulfosarcina sp. OttesenSCG-928-G17]MDL2329814.1 formylglycine-generating enzyme family protein [Desulfosarcina sp. OttesenSCG-928-A07]
MKNRFLPLLFILWVCCLGSATPALSQVIPYTNSIDMEFVLIPTRSSGMEFIYIPPGSFKMGCDPFAWDCQHNETPEHPVTLTKPFYLGKYPVTQAQWVKIMGSNPSQYKGRTRPVEQVSWEDTQEFIRRLNQKEGHNRYRLPTEAEWEYAARAGSQSIYTFGDDPHQLKNYAWYDGNDGTYPVGQLQPNKWGLYDMYGNVWEWVQDWYEENYYANSPGTDPHGPPSGKYRVLRGGGWFSDANGCRSATRGFDSPVNRNDNFGFRLALSPK